MFFFLLYMQFTAKEIQAVNEMERMGLDKVRFTGPCCFRPFDFYSILKIENQNLTIVIFNV